MTDKSKDTRGDDGARQWASELAGAFGEAVQLHRKRLGLSAVQLSNRCSEIGYPITRASLARIETNSRNSKMDVAEVLTLAAALEVSPSDLAFSGYPDRVFRATPRVEMESETAVAWFIGDQGYNEYEQLHTPRITQSKDLASAITDYRNALQGFENRHQIMETASPGSFFLADQKPDEGKDSREVAWFARTRLKNEYDQIQSLRDKVESLGGYIELPGWFGTYLATPF